MPEKPPMTELVQAIETAPDTLTDDLLERLSEHTTTPADRRKCLSAMVQFAVRLSEAHEDPQRLDSILKILEVVKIISPWEPSFKIDRLSQALVSICHRFDLVRVLDNLSRWAMGIPFSEIERGSQSQCQLSKCALEMLIALGPTILQSSVPKETQIKYMYLLSSLGDRWGLLPGLTEIVLKRLVETFEIDDSIHAALEDFAKVLVAFGIPSLDTVALMYREAHRVPAISSLLLRTAEASGEPASILFDLSTSGHASLEPLEPMSMFPPIGEDAGYTLMLWFNVMQYDETVHTSLFGAFDSSQSCFVLLYVEKQTHHLILQTSISSSQPSVRFTSKSFSLGQWYHVAIIHKHGRGKSSPAALFVDGIFSEQLQATYPGISNGKRGAIQAFAGTPRALSTQLSPNVIKTQWSLASMQLLARPTSDDLLAVYYELGPRYVGNFQDCLGSFQTYEASARLNILNENLHPAAGQDHVSQIVQATRCKAGLLLPEADIMLNFAAQDWTATATGPRFLQNHSVMHGGAQIQRRYPLDDQIWCLSGAVPFCLGMLERSANPTAMHQSLEFLFTCIKSSWRNSEAMEKDYGFVIMSDMLRDLFDRFSYASPLGTWQESCLAQTLKFIGYKTTCPEESRINNPMAYRILLVDLGLWRHGPSGVQKLYFDHVYDLVVRSKNHRFNIRRLVRMRRSLYSFALTTGVVKKWLDDILYMSTNSEALASFWRATQSLIVPTVSTELLRSIAIFITFCIRHSFGQAAESCRPRRRATTGSSYEDRQMIDEAQQMSLGLQMLRILTKVISSHDQSLSKRFAKIVTEKWLLYLMASSNKEVVSLAWQMLIHTLLAQPPFVTSKFLNRAGCCLIIGIRLEALASDAHIWQLCFQLMFRSSSLVDSELDSKALIADLCSATNVAHPEISSVLTRMLRRVITSDQKVLDLALDTFLGLYEKSAAFREFTSSSDFIQELFSVLSPLITGTPPLDPDAELSFDSSELSASSQALLMHPLGQVLDADSERPRLFVDHEKVTTQQRLKAPSASPKILEFILQVFIDNVLNRKDFTGLGLFMRAPPGIPEHQAQLETFLLDHTLERILTKLESETNLFSEPRVLCNLARLAIHLAEAVNEGWYMGGTDPCINFMSKILQTLDTSEMACRKSVRLCSQNVAIIRTSMCRLLIIRLSESPDEAFLKVFSAQIPFLDISTAVFLPLLGFLLVDALDSMFNAATNVLRLLVIHYKELPERSESFANALLFSKKPLRDLPSQDNDEFRERFSQHRQAMHDLMAGALAPKWTEYVSREKSQRREIAKARRARRREKLSQLAVEAQRSRDALGQHNTGCRSWLETMTRAESSRRQRIIYDDLDNREFNKTRWVRNRRVLDSDTEKSRDARWRFDQTEGRSRMRIRLNMEPDDAPQQVVSRRTERFSARPETESDFEMIADSAFGDTEEEEEDRHRKVLRSLQPGDPVESVYNISQMVGLEAAEGLLIIGNSHLYLVEGLCQRSDGNLIYLDQATPEERDLYLTLISGKVRPRQRAFETRSWYWKEVLSVSRRRFLFRDVAIEVFFVDGQSCLFIARNAGISTSIYEKVMTKVPTQSHWRLDSLPTASTANVSLGRKLTNAFSLRSPHAATSKWLKGEISNFHYLMLINTLAGRTFNDLTQYPVFPWILADYSSKELDLSKKTSFRDLTKPMGCQDAGRERDFQDRYESFAGMDVQNAFHYGTHYSSAMIVSSFLVRLPPFVHSYLLLQGGSFDHADRMFYSIEKAWASASRGGMSDVRELIPEFFCLPEFLVNVNGYDFGACQGGARRIDEVELPPWAKGDPKIFIARHREALESEYVTQNLPAWIDLIFGVKQRGEAAVAATNVYHHLSYHGARDLDKIDDPVERAATIGIIHNFGQTPHQIFTRAHPQRERMEGHVKRLDHEAEALTCLPFPDNKNQPDKANAHVSRLDWSLTQQAPVPSKLQHLAMGPAFDVYLKYGFFDGSLRFYTTTTHKQIGLFEHIHVGRLSTAVLVDDETLVTGSDDCSVSVWKVRGTSEAIQLVPKRTLFGHRASIGVLAVSRSLSILLSAASDGHVRLWDINQQSLVRVLTTEKMVQTACINDVTGLIVLGSGAEVSLWTINGELLVQQEIPTGKDDRITACAVYEGTGVEYLSRQLIFTGHCHGVLNIWALDIFGDRFTLEHVKRMDHVDLNGHNVAAAITAILPRDQAVFTGDSDGRICEWNLVSKR